MNKNIYIISFISDRNIRRKWNICTFILWLSQQSSKIIYTFLFNNVSFLVRITIRKGHNFEETNLEWVEWEEIDFACLVILYGTCC